MSPHAGHSVRFHIAKPKNLSLTGSIKMKLWFILIATVLIGAVSCEDDDTRGLLSWLFPPLDPLPEDLEALKPNYRPPPSYGPRPYGRPYPPTYKPAYKPMQYGDDYKPAYDNPPYPAKPLALGGAAYPPKPVLGKPSAYYKTPIAAANKKENIAAGISGLLAMGKGHLRPLNIVLNIPATPAVSASKSAELAKEAALDKYAIKSNLEALLGLIGKGGSLAMLGDNLANYPGQPAPQYSAPSQYSTPASVPVYSAPSVPSMVPVYPQRPQMMVPEMYPIEVPQQTYYPTTTPQPMNYATYQTTTATYPTTTTPAPYTTRRPALYQPSYAPLQMAPVSVPVVSYGEMGPSYGYQEYVMRNSADEDLPEYSMN